MVYNINLLVIFTSMKNLFILTTLTLFLASCVSGSGTSATTSSSSSFLSAAPIHNATCDLFKVAGGTKTGTSLQTVSSNLGKVEFKDIDYSGAALIECTGGTYNDEATDVQKTQPPLRSVINFSPNGSFAITPLTEIAFQMDSNLDNVLGTYNATVANAFGMSGKNITEILPTDIDNNTIENTDSGNYATILTGLSQMEETSSKTLTTIITELKTDLADNTLNITNRDELRNALENAKTTGANITTKLNNTVIKNLRDTIFTGNFTSGVLNDTGLTWGGDYPSGNNTTCTGETIAAQDCSSGRDAGLSLAYSTFTYAAGVGTTKTAKIGGGVAGFDFTKLGSDGTPLTIQTATWTTGGLGTEALGTKWSCVRDNVTGLVWEVKTDAGVADSDTTDNNHTNIHHKDNTYRWGGKTAIGKNHASKEGDYYDDWTGLVDGTNNENLCGFNDWRVPTREELRSIVHYGKTNPTIDTNYFPNTIATYFWSSSPNAFFSSNAWLLYFNYGYDNFNLRYNSYRVRLVRFGQ
jgi:hypothetical protein